MKWYKNLQISQQLIFGFLIIALVAGTVGLIGILNLMSMRTSESTMNAQTLALEYSSTAAMNFQQYNYYALRLTTLTSPTDLDNTMSQMKQFKDFSTNNLGKLKSSAVMDSDTLALIEKIDASWGNYQSTMALVSQAVHAGDLETVKSLVINQLFMIGTNMRNDYNNLFKQISDEVAMRAQVNTQRANTAIYLMIIVIVVGVIISIGLGLIIARAITKPLANIMQAADYLAVGNIVMDTVLRQDEQRRGRSASEIGMLKASFQKLAEGIREQVLLLQTVAEGDLTNDISMRSENDILGMTLVSLSEKLNGLIATIVELAERVARDATVVSDSSYALSQGAAVQAASIQELTASVHEVLQKTNMNAHSAKEADALSKNAKALANLGNTEVNQLLASMDDIGVSARGIQKIIRVIDDIAFQTNILALNAAVESARAGSAGRGFAVVAQEVRRLATTTANAAKETVGLIEKSISHVDAGTQLAKVTAVRLGEIVTEVEKASDLIGVIATGSLDQTVSIEQITIGLSMVSSVVQTNVATSEESAAASETLSYRAAQLKETVRVFKLKAHEPELTCGMLN